MINIRAGIFETNSSSMDRYDDSDSLENKSKAFQLVHIEYEYNDDINEDMYEELDAKLEKSLNNNYEILAPVLDLFSDGDCHDPYVEDGEIKIEVACTYDISWYGEYSPATRYEPEEFPEMEIDDSDELPGKGDDWKNMKVNKEDIKEQLLKNLKENGFSEIKRITDIYGDEVNSDEIYDNVY